MIQTAADIRNFSKKGPLFHDRLSRGYHSRDHAAKGRGTFGLG